MSYLLQLGEGDTSKCRKCYGDAELVSLTLKTIFNSPGGSSINLVFNFKFNFQNASTCGDRLFKYYLQNFPTVVCPFWKANNFLTYFKSKADSVKRVLYHSEPFLKGELSVCVSTCPSSFCLHKHNLSIIFVKIKLFAFSKCWLWRWNHLVWKSGSVRLHSANYPKPCTVICYLCSNGVYSFC